MNANDLLSAALGYGKRGWRVFPVHSPTGGTCSCGKADCRSIGKHSRVKGWLEVAGTSESTIRQWWQRWPDANIGIATGRKSGLVVLDVDEKNGKHGDASLTRLCEQHNWHPQTFTVETACGRHYYFQHPGGTVKGGACLAGPGLDIQAVGNKRPWPRRRPNPPRPNWSTRSAS